MDPDSIAIGRFIRRQRQPSVGRLYGAVSDLPHAFIERHKIRPVLERTFALDRYADAIALMSAGDFVGKIVLTL